MNPFTKEHSLNASKTVHRLYLTVATQYSLVCGTKIAWHCINEVLFFLCIGLRLSMLEKLIYIEYLDYIYLPKVSCGNLKTFFFQNKMAFFNTR